MTHAENESPVPKAPYPNAPIIEAVIDIHVTLPPNEADALMSFANAVTTSFPRKESLHELQLQFKPGDSKAEATNVGQIGWKLFSAQNDRIVLLRKHGFAYSHMAPYTEWGTFRKECKPLWQKFVEVCKPIQVTRLA